MKQMDPTAMSSKAMADQERVLDEVENSHRSSLKTSRVANQGTLMSQMSYGHLISHSSSDNIIYIYIYVAGTFRDHVNNILVYTCNEHLYELE